MMQCKQYQNLSKKKLTKILLLLTSLNLLNDKMVLAMFLGKKINKNLQYNLFNIKTPKNIIVIAKKKYTNFYLLFFLKYLL